MTDQELIDLGTREAIGELLARYKPLLIKAARSAAPRGTPPDVLDDLVQAAALGVLEALPRFDPERSPWTAHAWVAARRAAVSEARRIRHALHVPDVPAALAARLAATGEVPESVHGRKVGDSMRRAVTSLVSAGWVRLDQPTPGLADTNPHDTIAPPAADVQISDTPHGRRALVAWRALATKLPERVAQAIIRTELFGARPIDVAEELGVSRQAVHDARNRHLPILVSKTRALARV